MTERIRHARAKENSGNKTENDFLQSEIESSIFILNKNRNIVYQNIKQFLMA